MGGKPIRPRQHIYFCLALLISLLGCSLVSDSNRQRDLRDGLANGHELLLRGDFLGSLKAFEGVSELANGQPPADEAVYNIGLVYADSRNSQNDRSKAIRSFNRIIAEFPASPWAEEARIWVGVLNEAEASRLELEKSKQIIEKFQQEVESSRQALEKSRQDIENSRQEIDKIKQIIEKSKQIDIEIEQKRRDRGR